MSDINYREKYEAMSHWVTEMIKRMNDLYSTIAEQIVTLTIENDELRKALDIEKMR